MVVKLFNNVFLDAMEKDINDFLVNPSVELLNINIVKQSMHDLFHDGTVRNQWEEYTGIVTYKEI